MTDRLSRRDHRAESGRARQVWARSRSRTDDAVVGPMRGAPSSVVADVRPGGRSGSCSAAQRRDTTRPGSIKRWFPRRRSSSPGTCPGRRNESRGDLRLEPFDGGTRA